MFSSEVAQWERAGLITLRSLDRNQPSLTEQRVAVPSRTSLFEVFPRFHHSCSAVVFQCFFWSDLRPALLALSSVRCWRCRACALSLELHCTHSAPAPTGCPEAHPPAPFPLLYALWFPLLYALWFWFSVPSGSRGARAASALPGVEGVGKLLRDADARAVEPLPARLALEHEGALRVRPPAHAVKRLAVKRRARGLARGGRDRGGRR